MEEEAHEEVMPISSLSPKVTGIICCDGTMIVAAILFHVSPTRGPHSTSEGQTAIVSDEF